MSNDEWSYNQQSDDIDFIYSDTDLHCNEIAELYSYTEENEFHLNKHAFEELMEENNLPNKWFTNTKKTKHKILELLINVCELSNYNARLRGIRSLLYLLQGAFGECTTIREQSIKARENVFFLYDNGIFTLFVQLLYLHIDQSLDQNSQKRQVVSLNDSTDLRLILSALCTFVEVINCNDNENDTEYERNLIDQFKQELGQPIPISDELLSITLFQMVTKFCNGSAPQFPIKKVLLLLWKVLLASLGGMSALVKLKNIYRANANLPPIPDETIEVAKTMRPSSPPLCSAEMVTELVDGQKQRKLVVRPFKRQMMIKQTSMIGEDNGYQENGDSNNGFNEGIDMDDEKDIDREMRSNDSLSQTNGETNGENGQEKMETEPRPSSPTPTTPTTNKPYQGYSIGSINNDDSPFPNKRLPWVPKVRSKDIDLFLESTRMKFLGYVLPNSDQTTLAGLPDPILEGIRILKDHLYMSLAEAQMKRDDEISKYPLTTKELDETSLNSPVEFLYQAMLPNLPQYMIALLKILLAAAPTPKALKAKTEPINITSDVLPEEMPMNVFQSMKLGIDVNRHKEIIIKAVSSILLLLLKHYKINHIYQFENICQQLMFANCIPLVLKFFNQNLYQYVKSKYTISVIDFPACVIGEQPELTTETLEIGDTQQFSYRNLLSSINLARILNKLAKWKHSRIMMLVVFKSAPIFKRALKVRHPLLQLYFLKLLKMQAKYMGRQWKKFNMKTMSAIYQKVRHRLTDDWAYGNEIDCRPWDFQGEEFTLQANINRFHTRRYEKISPLPLNLFTIPNTISLQANNPNCANANNGGIYTGNNANGPNLAGNLNNANGLLNISSYSFQQNLVESDLLSPVDTNLLSVLSQEVDLTNEFKYHYDKWLESEVFQFNVDWDQLILSTDTLTM